jgi:uncharacterized protein with ATP-grasp and redox domains
MQEECIQCFHKQANKLIVKYKLPDQLAKELIFKFNKFCDNHRENNLSTPEASRYLNRLFQKAVDNRDLFNDEKKEYNRLLLGLEEEIRNNIKKSADPFQTALRYALAGNIIDFGPSKAFDALEVLSSAVSKKPAIDHSGLLQDELAKGAKVLYLGDNAGEIVLDKLFIETISHPHITFAVRGGNVINDATLQDAKSVGIRHKARVISNGYDAPSTILEKCSPTFQKVFNEADVVISKGQGNLEGLIHNTHKKIFFLLMVKCNVIAKITGVKEGDAVIFYNQFIKNNIA